MTATLSWQQQDNHLFLQGELTRMTLMPLWQIRQQLSHISIINVTDLHQVDSAGLALLLHLQKKNGESAKLDGVNSKLETLITLYNLQQVVNHD